VVAVSFYLKPEFVLFYMAWLTLLNSKLACLDVSGKFSSTFLL
jgi:hypothetical protein